MLPPCPSPGRAVPRGARAARHGAASPEPPAAERPRVPGGSSEPKREPPRPRSLSPPPANQRRPSGEAPPPPAAESQ